MATSRRPTRPRARRDQAAVRAAARAEQRIDSALRGYAARLERTVLQARDAGDRRRLIAAETRTLRQQLLAAIGDARDAVSRSGARQGLYEQLGPVGWRQRVTEYVQEAAAETARLGTRAARGGLSPAELSRALRDRVVRPARYKARRIAVSEAFNASAENDLSRFAEEGIHAVRWVPTSRRPCRVCVSIASSDLYGLGAGVYPLARVPLPPHPFCRCRRRPVRGLDEQQVARARRQRDAELVVEPGLTPERAERVRARVRSVIRGSERHRAAQRREAA